MQITVFGASGKIGREVVATALAKGHEVVAFVHNQNPLEAHDGLTVIKGDVRDTAAVAQAVHGADAVISTLGSWHTPSKDILTSAMRAVVPAMEQTGAQRIITLTGAGAYAPGDKPTAFYKLGHALFGVFAGKIIKDGEEHVRILAASKLDWTVLRSPIMTNGHSAAYRLGLKAPGLWQTIPRRAVVQAIIDQLEGPAYTQHAPFISKL